VIDTSTGDPQATVKMAMRLKDRGVDYLDATVSGSSDQVLAGTAVMLVGASANSFETYQTILKAMVPHVMHVGATGSGAQMKLVTNLVLGLNRAVLAEGLAYAQMLCLPLDKALAVLRASMAYSRIMDTKGEKMINRDFTPQARLSQHAKDVRLILSDAERHRLRLPLTQAHQALLQYAMDLGLGDLDNSAIVQVYEA
jgi:3-hydroxyisobutyrate dehydrogenase-like beta-hydroxyacid dehydrogenase